MTAKELKDFLKFIDDDVIVRTVEDDIIGLHIVDNILILSDKKPIGYGKDGYYVYPSTLTDYKGYSPSLDENLYDFEITPFKEGSWELHWQTRLENSK